jgi:DegV family protein with EDD domain
MTIRIVTDSASDIPWDFAKKNNIKVVPLYVVVHGEVLKEDENFDRDSYYQIFEDERAFVHIPMLNMHSFVPNTSQPNPQDFEIAYKEAIEEGAKDIIVVNVTAGLSGTTNSSNLAAKKIMRKNPNVKIHIVDAKSASYPEVFLIRMALNLIKQKKSAEEIVEILNEQAIKIRTIILLPTIFYLWKGGRLGRFGVAKFALGSLLKKKPIVTMNEEGYVKTAGEAKDVHEGLRESLRLSLENAPTEPKAFTIVYGSRKDYAEELADLIREKYPKIEIEIAQSGGSVLSHLGPESIGLITDYTDDEHWE